MIADGCLCFKAKAKVLTSHTVGLESFTSLLCVSFLTVDICVVHTSFEGHVIRKQFGGSGLNDGLWLVHWTDNISNIIQRLLLIGNLESVHSLYEKNIRQKECLPVLNR